MRTVALLTILMMALAGCNAPEDGPAKIEDKIGDDYVPEETLGAIAGLLVDDRFRPVDLEDEGDAGGEFQAEGFVLLQETGEQRKTNENGEFSFIDLEPGTYTLRVSAEGHEATPQKIQVSAGQFSEINIVARRTATTDDVTITTDYGVFVPCAFDAVVIGMTHGYCFFDMSGESYRAGFEINLLETPHDAVVLEVLTNQNQGYTMILRAPGDTSFGGAYFAEKNFEGYYARTWLKMGEVNDIDDYRGNVAWENQAPLDALLFYKGDFQEELAGINDGSATCIGTGQQLADDRLCRAFSGVGQTMGMKASFLQTVFLGEAPADFREYCALC